MVNNIKFEAIREISLRNYFSREDKDFTPWIQENINLLGDAIGIDISDADIEVPIGGFRLDVLATESGVNRKIAIENQFGTTDHSHLGQLLTYMAGAEAEIVVWIAENFKDEHITAINHLNQISDEDIYFFCIRPRIIKIGDSKPALEFLPIAQPDEWEKSTKSGTEIESKYKKFWAKLLNTFAEMKPGLPKRRPTKSTWLAIYTGYRNIHFEWVIRKRPVERFDAALHFERPDKEENLELLEHLRSKKHEFEKKIPDETIIFDENWGERWTQIYVKRDSGALDESNIEWGAKTMCKFYGALKPILDELNPK